MATLARRKPAAMVIVEELPLTPMIDVVFQLIIFFMLMPMQPTIEGRLFSQLPKDKGPQDGPSVIENVLRIYLRPGNDDSETVIRIGHNDLGMLRRSVIAGREERDPDAAKANRATWRGVADRIDEFYRRIPVSRVNRPNPVVIDAVNGTPWEHVIGLIDACKSKGIDNVEFSANPDFRDLFR